MNKTIKHEDTWYLFQDGNIGVLTLDGNEYAIASGEPGNYTAYDYDLTPLHKAVKVGPVSKFPTIEAAIEKIKRMHKITKSGIGGQAYNVEKECARAHEIISRFLENAAI